MWIPNRWKYLESIYEAHQVWSRHIVKLPKFFLYIRHYWLETSMAVETIRKKRGSETVRQKGEIKYLDKRDNESWWKWGNLKEDKFIAKTVTKSKVLQTCSFGKKPHFLPYFFFFCCTNCFTLNSLKHALHSLHFIGLPDLDPLPCEFCFTQCFPHETEKTARDIYAKMPVRGFRITQFPRFGRGSCWYCLHCRYQQYTTAKKWLKFQYYHFQDPLWFVDPHP